MAKLTSRYYVLCALITLTVVVGVLQLAGCGHTRQLPGSPDSTVAAHFTIASILPLPDDVGGERRTAVHHFKGEWFVLPPYSGQLDTFALIRIGVDRTDSLLLPTPNAPAFDRRGSFRDVSISDRHIVLLYWRAVVIYDRTATGVMSPRIIALGDSSYYSRLSRIGSEYYLTSMYIGDERREKTWACRIDVEAGRIVWERTFPDANGIEFTLFAPRRSIEISHNEVFIADLDRYRILVYDHEGHKIDSMTRSIPGWDIDTSYTRHSLAKNPMLEAKNAIDSLREYAYGRPNIRLITLLDTSTLLVTVEYPETYRKGRLRKAYITRHDIWKRVDETWSCAVKDAIDFNPMSGDRWDDHRMLPMGVSYIPFGDRYFGQIKPYSGHSYEGKTYGQLTQELDSFLLENEPRHAIIVFKERDGFDK